MEDQVEPAWRKATYSGNGGSDCVEVAESSGAVLLRDTKDRGGVVLSVGAGAWQRFTAGLR